MKTDELFNAGQTPFNLAGDLLDQGITPEGEARKRAQAEAEARKVQLTFDPTRTTSKRSAPVSSWGPCSTSHKRKR